MIVVINKNGFLKWTGGAGVGISGPHAILSGTHVDTNVAVPANNDVLTWDDGAGQWKAAAPVAGGLNDPGANGIVTRTALNTTGVAAASDVTGLFSGAGDYLKSDGTKGTPAGTGDVVGPAGATDGHLAIFDGGTGKLLKDGGPIPAGGGGDFLVMQVFS